MLIDEKALLAAESVIKDVSYCNLGLHEARQIIEAYEAAKAPVMGGVRTATSPISAVCGGPEEPRSVGGSDDGQAPPATHQPVDLTRLIGDALSAWLDNMGIKIGGKNNEDSDCRWFLAQNIAMVVRPHIAQPMREAGDPKEVRKFLLHHRLKYTLHGEDGLPLLDRLTPDGVMNTSLGWEEVDLLTEALFEHFDIRRRGSDD